MVALNMDEKKANLTGDIPAGIMKVCVDSYISILAKLEYFIRNRLFYEPTDISGSDSCVQERR